MGSLLFVYRKGFDTAALEYCNKGAAPKVSKGRSESPLGSEAFVASGDREKAERVSRNERPLAATIEAADAARRRETSAFGKAIVLSENSMSGNACRKHQAMVE